MNVVKTASLIVLFTLIGRLLGFFRSVYVSSLYGTGMEADAFSIAVNIPMTLFLVVPGAINAVLIPTMRGLLEKGERTAALYHKLLALVLIVFCGLSVAGVVFSDQIAQLFGLTGEKAALTAEMLQWMWPSALFIGLAGLWSSVCNAHQHFFTPTLGTVTNGALVIVAMFVLVPSFGATGLAIATTLGYLAAWLTMWPTMRRFGYEHRISFSWKEDEAMRSMGERVIPILIGAVIAQATTFMERGFAANLGEGKNAALYFANQIVQMPMAIFVGAFTLPLFPLLASYVKRGEIHLMKDTLQKGLAYLLILLIPVTVGLIMYGEPLIRLVFERGAFGGEAVEATTTALVFYSLGIYALAARDLITRAFYALENTRTPVVIGALGIGVYIVSNWLLIPQLGHGGVALSAAVSAFSQALLLFVLLWRQIGSPVRSNFLMTTGKVAAACAVMAAEIALTDSWLSQLPLWLYLALGIGIAAVFYLFSLWLLREPLVNEVMLKLLRRSRVDSTQP
jgi:putative peptidoglycan lipid II flippase